MAQSSVIAALVGARRLLCHGLSVRKLALLRQFVSPQPVHPLADARALTEGDVLLLWGAAPLPEGLPLFVQIVRVEDGFLRSVGLGADLVRPVSWVFDRRGIYFDPTTPSDLEHLLQNGPADADRLQRARALRERLVAAGLTKYNLPPGSIAWRRPEAVKEVILVAGQVESDASIQKGAVGVRTNIDLLRAARALRPQAWIVYKPHPDVVAGLRAAGQGENEARALCDELLTDGDMHLLLNEVDEIHVITSLTGFEALLRGRRVVCHGQPFYSGWGLTTDAAPHSRRARALTLDELVAGALIDYPIYISRKTGRPCEPEQAVDELLAWRAKAPAQLPWWRRAIRPLLRRE